MAAAAPPASMRSPGAAQVVSLGAGEILLTSMDRDGTGQGFDLDLLRAVCGAVRLPVIASGGVGTLAAFRRGRAGRRDRPARRQRVPLRHLHHRPGQGGACMRPACRCACPAEAA